MNEHARQSCAIMSVQAANGDWRLIGERITNRYQNTASPLIIIPLTEPVRK